MLAEYVPRDLAVVVGERGGEKVERDPDRFPIAQDLGVIAVDNLLWVTPSCPP